MTIFLQTSRLFIEKSSLNHFSHWIDLYRESETQDTVQQWLVQDMHHFEKHGFGMGSVYEKESKKFIGRAGLVYLDYDDTQPDIELGYVFHQTAWGKGYATELGKALITWEFSHLSINKLVAVTRPENKKSQHVLKKLKMNHSKFMSFRGEKFLFYEILNTSSSFVFT